MKINVFNSVKDNIKNGDLISFSGNGISSRVIKLVTHSKYSHVGMAIWADFTHDGLSPSLYIAESTTSNDVQDISGDYRKGMQIVLLEDRIKTYDGLAWWFPMLPPLTEQERYTFINSMITYHDKCIKYDTLGAMEAGFDDLFDHRTHFSKNDPNEFFCSEAVSNVLKNINRISKDTNPGREVPEDVTKFKCFGEPIALF